MTFKGLLGPRRLLRDIVQIRSARKKRFVEKRRKHENNLIKLNVEVWRSIDGYNNYAISTFGKVKNTKTGKILKGFDNGHGYLQIDLYENAIKKAHKVHRLVACAFINNPDNKECVDHKDNNPQNNHISNLRFASYSENSQNSKRCSWHKQISSVYLNREKYCSFILLLNYKLHICRSI